MTEAKAREELASYGRSLFARGYSCGTSGNLSVRLADGTFLMSPTNVSLGRLDPAGLSRLDGEGRHTDGPPPTKESWLHLAMYASRPQDAAVVHLHSTYAVALSCRTDRAEDDMVPALTPYVVMRVGRVARVPYSPPGDGRSSETVAQLARAHRALLLANHGPVVSGDTLEAAVFAMEELEETAKLYLLLRGLNPRYLTPAQVADLTKVFGLTLPEHGHD
jgi:ribulose-5-phosphate 4-epimerase/fuculose-1-phosphate aldolase